MGDKLVVNLGAKCHRQFVISHLKLQSCYCNGPYVSVPRWRQVVSEEIRALKDAPGRSTSRSIPTTGILACK